VALGVGVGGPSEPEDITFDGGIFDTFISTAGKSVKQNTMDVFTATHTSKSSGSGKVEVVFLLLSLV